MTVSVYTAGAIVPAGPFFVPAGSIVTLSDTGTLESSSTVDGSYSEVTQRNLQAMSARDQYIRVTAGSGTITVTVDTKPSAADQYVWLPDWLIPWQDEA